MHYFYVNTMDHQKVLETRAVSMTGMKSIMQIHGPRSFPLLLLNEYSICENVIITFSPFYFLL